MCGIQSVLIGMAAASEPRSKCYVLIHGMRADAQPRRINCAISGLCAVLTQWGEKRSAGHEFQRYGTDDLPQVRIV